MGAAACVHPPHITLARLDRPIGWWLLVLPGWWIFAAFSPGWQTAIWYMALFTVGAVAMRAVGCVINDLWDRDIDAQIERTRARPLASGQLSVAAAFIFLMCLSGLGLLVLLQLPVICWGVGVAALPLVILYPLAKRFTDWPQIVLGFTFSWAIPVAVAVLWQSWPPAGLWLIYAGCVCWVVGYDTIYAVQDMPDDRLTGADPQPLRLADISGGGEPVLPGRYRVLDSWILGRAGPGSLAGRSWPDGLSSCLADISAEDR